MSMAVLVTLFAVLCFSVGNAQTFVSVDCKAENAGQYGKPTMLECIVHFTVEDANIMMVTWKKEGVDKPLLAYKRNDNTATDLGRDSGYQFADESWDSSNTNVSLLITNTEMTHTGRYKCTVITDRGWYTGSTNLEVTAKYNKLAIEKIVSPGENGFECHAEGGYPQGKLQWIVNNDRWQQIIETDVKKSSNGLYNLSSTLTLTKDSPFSKFTCVLINGSGLKENEFTLEIPEDPGRLDGNQPQSPAKIVAPLVVIGSLIVGLLLLVVFLRRRSRQVRRPSATPLMREPQVYRCECDAEQGVDQETVDKCEKKPCLTE